jgi:molecular chaperone DnaK (HSP70)
VNQATYIVGIDLGTTNTVLAYTPIQEDVRETPPISVLEIPQLVGPGEVAAAPLLPSFILRPDEHHMPQQARQLPWEADLSLVVGQYARDRGAELPQRLIASAKSWLCNAMVDRNEPILPWQAPEEVPKLSPVQAAAAVLDHIRRAWNHAMARDDENLTLEKQELFLTVPASFDAVARDLTVKAAELAHLPHITLLEEPQAAFYAWIESAGEDWRKVVSPGDLALVCDLGGGTSDFTLIQVSQEEGELVLERIAVGDHLLVGGDNMDLALAYAVARQFAEDKVQLDAWQMRALWHSCRSAKEKLLAEPKRKKVPVTILGRGSSLIGDTLRSDLTRQMLEEVILEGFFPFCERDSQPAQVQRSGIRETGLAYTADPAVTRQLAHFLNRRESSAESIPSVVLFNGGVNQAPILRERLLGVLSAWQPETHADLRELAAPDRDLAVARGAAYYGQARRGRGIRIRSGLAKTYYIGIAAAMPAVPGIPAPIKALCVAPFGMEEGTDLALPDREFSLLVGEHVTFDFLVSGERVDDPAGAMIETWQGDIEPITTIETTLDGAQGDSVLVTLEVKLTEIGTLEIWCVAKQDQQRWKLEFNVRERS